MTKVVFLPIPVLVDIGDVMGHRFGAAFTLHASGLGLGVFHRLAIQIILL
jgi:hypothetical protein